VQGQDCSIDTSASALIIASSAYTLWWRLLPRVTWPTSVHAALCAVAVAEESERYTSFLREVSERSGKLVGLWQALGFVHGVLNTDNCSILGLTIDYGPYGFIDA